MLVATPPHPCLRPELAPRLGQRLLPREPSPLQFLGAAFHVKLHLLIQDAIQSIAAPR